MVLVIAGGASDGDVRLLQTLIDAYGVRAHTRVHANFLAASKPDLLAAADVVVSVVDNTQETFGLSILEALGHGRPVVASRFDGYKDLVDHGVDGLLVDTLWCEADPLAGLGDVMDPNVAQLIQAQSVAIDTEQLADHLRRADRRRAAPRWRWARPAAPRSASGSAPAPSSASYEALWDELAAAAGDARRLAHAERRRSRRPAPVAPADRRPGAVAGAIFRAYPTGFLSPDDSLATVPGVAIDPPYSDVARAARSPAARGDPRSLRRAGPGPRRGGAGADRGARLVRRDVAAEVRRAARVSAHG